MSTGISWRCPYCDCHAIVDPQKYTTGVWCRDGPHVLQPMIGDYQATTIAIICPNSECGKLSLEMNLKKLVARHSMSPKDLLCTEKIWSTFKQFQILPHCKARSFPDYVPEAIRKNYEEACLIVSLSPNASATLARRCLQGMIRDFYHIKKDNLKCAIEGLEEKVDPLVWQAIDTVRKMGNIGAHMELDVNMMIDVDQDEAKKLIELIEYLIEEWYVRRHDNEQKLEKIAAIPSDKKERAEKQQAKARDDGTTS